MYTLSRNTEINKKSESLMNGRESDIFSLLR